VEDSLQTGRGRVLSQCGCTAKTLLDVAGVFSMFVKNGEMWRAVRDSLDPGEEAAAHICGGFLLAIPR
jgi:hypothetical protein